MQTYKVVFLMMVSLLLACSSMASSQNKLEPLYAVSLSDKSIEFEVKSTGCTTAEDFKLNMRSADDHLILNIERIKIDRCRRMPKVISLSKAVDFSNIESNLVIMIDNPFKMKSK